MVAMSDEQLREEMWRLYVRFRLEAGMSRLTRRKFETRMAQHLKAVTAEDGTVDGADLEKVFKAVALA